jgi:dTDP-4-amino-4,6-dideoxygalactose transaminase
MYNAYKIVDEFEKAMVEFTNAPFAVAVESCSAAIFLCLQYYKLSNPKQEIKIPKYTYPSVAAAIVNSGFQIDFINLDWQSHGWYELLPTSIIDSAKRIAKNMYDEPYMNGSFICLSFHGKKVLPIGRGGMILTDSKPAYDWFKVARFDGRHECGLDKDTLAMAGWNMYLTPEQAARGLMLLMYIIDSKKTELISSPDTYPDLSRCSFYKE